MPTSRRGKEKKTKKKNEEGKKIKEIEKQKKIEKKTYLDPSEARAGVMRANRRTVSLVRIFGREDFPWDTRWQPSGMVGAQQLYGGRVGISSSTWRASE